MVCPRCGNSNPDIAQFCGKCGGPLAAQTPPPIPGAPVTGVSSEMRIIMIIATVVLPLIGIVMGIVYMNSADPGKKAAGRIWLLVGVGVAIVYCILSGLLSSIAQSS